MNCSCSFVGDVTFFLVWPRTVRLKRMSRQNFKIVCQGEIFGPSGRDIGPSDFFLYRQIFFPVPQFFWTPSRLIFYRVRFIFFSWTVTFVNRPSLFEKLPSHSRKVTVTLLERYRRIFFFPVRGTVRFFLRTARLDGLMKFTLNEFI